MSLSKIQRLNINNLSATIDILGEHTKSENEANNITYQYIELYKNTGHSGHLATFVQIQFIIYTIIS